jgi:hypothetical protein
MKSQALEWIISCHSTTNHMYDGTCLSECLEDGIKKINKMHEI